MTQFREDLKLMMPCRNASPGLPQNVYFMHKNYCMEGTGTTVSWRMEGTPTHPHAQELWDWNHCKLENGGYTYTPTCTRIMGLEPLQVGEWRVHLHTHMHKNYGTGTTVSWRMPGQKHQTHGGVAWCNRCGTRCTCTCTCTRNPY